MVPTRTITSPFLAETWRTNGMIFPPENLNCYFIGRTSHFPTPACMPDFSCEINLNSNRLAIKIVRSQKAILESQRQMKRGHDAESHFCDYLRGDSGQVAGFWPGTGFQQSRNESRESRWHGLHAAGRGRQYRCFSRR